MVPKLRAVGLEKSFGHVQALRGVDVEIDAGEIVGLVGDNGAGKSTFVKCVSGVYQPDRGQIEIEGKEIELNSPLDGRSNGIESVYQDLSLSPDISVSYNVYLGREIFKTGLLGKLGFMDSRQMSKKADDYIREVGIRLPTVEIPVEQLSGGQRQAVAIARARAWASKILLLDEPTAALGVRQTEIVLNIISSCKKQNMAVLVISHDIPSILRITDRIIVLRLGKVVANFQTKEVKQADVVSAIVGK
jgi:simple sugar transport system ATP-binding protein